MDGEDIGADPKIKSGVETEKLRVKSLFSVMGFPFEGITQDMINRYQGEVNLLKEKLGIPPDNFNLIIWNDMAHTQIQVICDLMIEQFEAEDAKELMMICHETGSVILKSGKYSELRIIRDNLRKKQYKTEISRIEK